MSKHIFLFLKEGTKIEEKEGIITVKGQVFTDGNRTDRS